jgi:uncharacterized protein (DUF2164 family)
MAIDLPKETQQDAIKSLQKYFELNMDGKLGNIAATWLLEFIVEEIGPSIYNKGVADAQARIQARLTELDYEVHEDEFHYWMKKGRK